MHRFNSMKAAANSPFHKVKNDKKPYLLDISQTFTIH